MKYEARLKGFKLNPPPEILPPKNPDLLGFKLSIKDEATFVSDLLFQRSVLGKWL